MKKSLMVVGLASLIVCAAVGTVFGGSSAGWIPTTSVEAPYISRNYAAVWNNDSSFSHTVATGFEDIFTGNGSTSKTIRVYGKNNGANGVYCTAAATNVNDGTTIYSSASTTVNGLYTLTMTLTPGFGTSVFFSVICSIPPVNPTASYVYAAGIS